MKQSQLEVEMKGHKVDSMQTQFRNFAVYLGVVKHNLNF